MPKKENQPKKRKKYDISAEDFCLLWSKCQSNDELVEELQKQFNVDMPKPIVMARAAGYRKKGINLKKMKRTPRNKIDADYLNKLMAQNGMAIPPQPNLPVANVPVQNFVQQVADEVVKKLRKPRRKTG